MLMQIKRIMTDYNFYLVYKTVNNILYNRGYEKPKTHDMSFEEFCKQSRDTLTIKTKSRSDYKIQRGSIYVFFPDETKVGVKPIREYKTKMEEENVSRAIVVVKEGVTPFAKNEIISGSRTGTPVFIETFTESQLIIDITEHELVPPHELLTKEEKKKVLESFKIKESQLPKITATDPISRYYGLQKGDVVKITRPSETAGSYVSYRVVIGAA
jgi:DNA-directed RNA polymerase I, II, and III subunit RPABC1